jgi:hypothetical protein
VTEQRLQETGGPESLLRFICLPTPSPAWAEGEMSLLTELNAYYTEHRRCRELNGGLDGPVVWFDCSGGARIGHHVTETGSPAA